MKINEKNLCGFAISYSPIDKEGWLLKRGDVNKSFQRRWFALKGNLLFYFEKKPDKEPSGVIVLEGCTIELAEYEEQYAFKVVFHGAGDRTYIMGADTQEAMEAWMKALACASYDYMKLMVLELQRKLDEIIELEKAHTSIFQNSKVGDSVPKDEEAGKGDQTSLSPVRLNRGNIQPKKINNRSNPFDRDIGTLLLGQRSSSSPGSPSSLHLVVITHGKFGSTQEGLSMGSNRVEQHSNFPHETTVQASRLCRPFFEHHELYGRTVKRDIDCWNRMREWVGDVNGLIDITAI